DGIDAAHKAALLAGLAYGFYVPFSDVYVEGIRDISPLDMSFAEKLGYTIKLLATIRPHDEKRVEVRIHPSLVARDHVLATINGVFNAVQVVGDVVGPTLFYGRGAGADPTASAVLADVIEAAQHVAVGQCGPFFAFGNDSGSVVPMDEVCLPFYARLTVSNRPGVLAQVAQIFGKHQIGISSVFQPEDHDGQTVPLVLLLDKAKEADLQSAIQEIKELDVVDGPCQVIRVEDLS
ncbi:MAG: homoserine dehydrogenase, partial [Verrucomicrobiota bacterium]